MSVAAWLEWLGHGLTVYEVLEKLLPWLLGGSGMVIAFGRNRLLPWLGRVPGGIVGTWRRAGRRRRYGARLRQLRAFDANPRLLVALIARRGVGMAMIASSLLMNDAMFASDHIRALDGHPLQALRWEMAMDAVLKLLVVVMFAFVATDAVERLEDWADPAAGRRRLARRYRRTSKGRR